jgi:hypothetical protein
LALALIVSLSAGALAAPAERPVFDSPEFWADHPSDFDAQQAWREGARWRYGDGAVVVYHGGGVYGFAQRSVPKDEEAHVQSRMEASFAKRAEMLAVHAAGVFGFGPLDCQAKADFESLAPDLSSCKKLDLLAKMTGEWKSVGFSVAKFSSGSICACRKALDRIGENRDCRIFFGPIARQELGALGRQGRRSELVDFFRKHHRKGVFGPDQFAAVVSALIEDGQEADALVILNAASQRFAGQLNTEQWEAYGDFYLSLSQSDLARAAFQKSIDTLYLDKRYDFEEACANN